MTSEHPPSRFSSLPFGLGILPFGALGILLIWHLAPLWSSDPQYQFGWLYLFAGPFLGWRRWLTRPAPEPGNRRPALICMAVAAFALLPTWLIAQPNPDWRMVNWALGIEIVCISLCALFLAGGSVWLRHFGFPICLILATVPWPTAVEIIVIQNSARFITDVSVESLNLMGVAAMAHGNVIELAGGTLGVDDACSGIRSLQATTMATLFIGELFRLRPAWRIGILAAGLLTAFISNIGRALLLAWVAAKQGISAVDQWHDPAGFAILSISLLVTWRIALWTPQHRIAPAEDTTPKPPPLPVGMTACLGAWLLLTLLGTEAWYRAHESDPVVRWSAKWPENAASFQRVPIPSATAQLLRYDRGENVRWVSDDGEAWVAYFFRWEPGPARSRQVVRSHSPEVCLPAIGCVLTSGPKLLSIQVGDLIIPFNAYTFAQKPDHTMHVFQTIWHDRAASAAISTDGAWRRWDAFRAVLAGQRKTGQQMLEVIIYSDEPPEKVEKAFARLMPRMIRE